MSRKYAVIILFAACLVLCVPLTAVAQTPTSTHIVQPGETIGQIATQYGLSAAQLTAHNHLTNPDLIFVGQVLDIPAETAVSVNAISHTVLPGQTLSGIALLYGRTVTDLTAANNITNPAYIQAGQTLLIPALPGAPTAVARQIVVDLSDQRVYAYDGETLVYDFLVSTGQAGMATAVGHYTIQNKLPNAFAYTWGLQMPYWMGIYWAGNLQNGFHALPILPDGRQLWRGYLGTPISYGCIVLSPEDATALYNWADVGLPVTIQP